MRIRRGLTLGNGILGILLIVVSYAPNASKEVITSSGTSSSKETAVSFSAAECENKRLQSRTLTLQGSFELTEIADYQNVFQTANVNEGVRLEIDDEGHVALVVGLGDGTKHTGILFKNSVRPRVRYEFLFEIRKSKSVFYRFLGEEGLRSLDGIRPICAHVLVGGGYDRSRSLHGQAELDIQIENNGLIGLEAHRLRTVGAICLYFFGLISINKRRDASQCQL